MKILRRVDIISYPLEDQLGNSNFLHPENIELYRKVSFVPTASIHMNKTDGISKEELFKQVPGLQYFVEHAFHNKKIIAFNAVIDLIVENGASERRNKQNG